MKRGWIVPIVVLAAVVTGVWYVVFRESGPERATRLIREGRTAMEAQDFATAEDRLKQALELAPNNGVLLHNLGIVYLKQKRVAEARTQFQRAAAAHGPQGSKMRAEELLQLAMISFGENNWKQAANELEQAIAADPTRAQLHTNLIDLQLGRLASPAAAESSTARYLRLCGRTPRHLGDVAYLHYTRGFYTESAELSRQAVALQDSFVEGHAMLARSLSKQGHLREGLKSLEGPIARYPNGAPLWVAKSLLLLDAQARAEALAAADRAVGLAPSDFESHQARQKALAALGRYQEASTEIDIARELTQDPADQRMLQAQKGILQRMMSADARTNGVQLRPDTSETGS